jgi:hypothetical protein
MVTSISAAGTLSRSAIWAMSQVEISSADLPLTGCPPAGAVGEKSAPVGADYCC